MRFLKTLHNKMKIFTHDIVIDKYLRKCVEVFTLSLYYFPILNWKSMIEQNIVTIAGTKDKQSIQELTKKCIKSVAGYVTDFISFAFNPAKHSLHLVNPEILKESNNPIICLSGHFRGFELFTLMPTYLSDFEILNLYDSKGIPKWFKNALCKLRNRHGAKSISNGCAFRDITQHLSQANGKTLLIGALADVEPVSNSSAGIIDFFNQENLFYTGIIKIGFKIQANFYYASIYPVHTFKYKVRFRPLSKQTYSDEIKMTQAFANELEKDISKYPYNWIPIISRKLRKT